MKAEFLTDDSRSARRLFTDGDPRPVKGRRSVHIVTEYLWNYDQLYHMCD